VRFLVSCTDGLGAQGYVCSLTCKLLLFPAPCAYRADDSLLWRSEGAQELCLGHLRSEAMHELAQGGVGAARTGQERLLGHPVKVHQASAGATRCAHLDFGCACMVSQVILYDTAFFSVKNEVWREKCTVRRWKGHAVLYVVSFASALHMSVCLCTVLHLMLPMLVHGHPEVCAPSPDMICKRESHGRVAEMCASGPLPYLLKFLPPFV
jgi:hypothetical protein